VKTLLYVLVFLISLPLNSEARVKKIHTFTETEFILKTQSGDLSGTFCIPDKVKKSPIVLIIAGSGPTDRDGNSPLGIKAGTYKLLAEGLARNGISSCRFDKRGIGKSQSAAKSESELRFETYINDVVDLVSFLKKDKRFSDIIILGHSEGSLIGIAAANLTDVSKVISIAGAGRPIYTVLREQLQSQLPEQLLQESDRISDSLRAGKTVKQINPLLLSLYRPSVQPYMISWFKYDPAIEIKKLKIPVLIIQGATDLQTTVEDAKLLSAAKTDARLLIIDNMNHILKEADIERQKNLATYSDPNLPLKEGLTEKITDFIRTGK
jgi:pimeloyl-ACP methyl ester carboxylesterase